jgi:VWFA-related protein
MTVSQLASLRKQRRGGSSGRLPQLHRSSSLGHGALLLGLAAVLGPAANAQQPAAILDEPAPVFRATVSLVQIDAVVTDRNGHYVTDLGADDFELLEDGKRQRVSNCSYIPIESRGVGEVAPHAMPGEVSPREPLRREQVQRTTVFVVDDLRLDLVSMASVQRALRTYVDSQMVPGDLVSILRTAGGVGALQQFTSDKRILGAAIGRVRFNPLADVDAFEPVGAIPVLPSPTSGRGSPGGLAARNPDPERRDLLTGGTIGALRFALTGLRELPGRKSLVLLSNGLPLYLPNGDGPTAFGRAVSALITLANQGSVVVYAVDTRGLTTGQLTATDNTISPGGMADTSISDFKGMLNARGLAGRLDGQDGLSAFAESTGGLFLHDQNDISRQLRTVLEDQRGYYLIGYVPPALAFRPEKGKARFHRIRLKVKRKGLAVRSRSGYYGIPEDDPQLAREREAATLLNALVSPFDSRDVGLHLSTLFFQDAVRGPLLHSFLRVDASNLSFAQDQGFLVAQVEALGATFDDEGRVIEQLGRDGKIRLSQDALERALERGINYTVDMPVKKPGAYQLRVAFRDTASGRVGSAYQFVEVPDLRRNRLSLSGILMSDAPSGDGLAPGEPARAEVLDTERGAAIQASRVFSRGQPLSYGLVIYNAQVTHDGRGVDVTTQMRLLHDGRVVVTGEPRRLEVANANDMKAVFTGSTLLLPTEMPEGHYVLQVTVIDALAPPKKQEALQTIDFEIVR